MPTVLVVEDETNIRQFVMVNLKARGYDVLQAPSAEEGLQHLRDGGPEALILDIKLPGMSGWDMLKVIIAESILPHIPVIIMTASPLSAQTGELVYPHIAATLIKPIGAADLILAVKKIFG
jgi:DNA-binding response OmpR family regulator